MSDKVNNNNDDSGTKNGGTLINPHNPEFITKKPWYLSGGADGIADGPTLDHQTDQRPEKQKIILSLTESENLILEQRKQLTDHINSNTFSIGQWIEALKKNKLPYRICQVIKIHNNNNNTSTKSDILLDLKFEDGSMERKVKVYNTNKSNNNNNRPNVRMTRTGNRIFTTATKLIEDGIVKESYDGKRDQYHGYDRDKYNTILTAKYQQRLELRKKIRHDKQHNQNQQQEQQEQQEQDQKQDVVDDNNNATNNNTDGGRKNKKSKNNEKNSNDTNTSNKSIIKEKESDTDFDDSDNESDHDTNNKKGDISSSDDDDNNDEFVQRDEDAKVITSRLARQGGVGGAQMKVTARNLRIREDTAKYLYNLNINSAYYDPKSRSMRDNPNPHIPLNETNYSGDNYVRISGDASELAETQLFVWDASSKAVSSSNNNNTEKGSNSNNNNNPDSNNNVIAELHPQANPSQAEFLKKEFQTKVIDAKLQNKRTLLDKYGGEEYLDGSDGLASAIIINTSSNNNNKSNNNSNNNNSVQQQNHNNDSKNKSENKSNTTMIDRKLRFGVSTEQEQYNIDGRLVKANDSMKLKKQQQNAKQQRQRIVSKYEEDIYMNGHISVWGSFFHMGAFTWGYADDHSLLRNSYCTGMNGRIANDEAHLLQYGTGITGSAELAQARVIAKHYTNIQNQQQQQQQQEQHQIHSDDVVNNTSTTTTTSSHDNNSLDPAKIRQALRQQQQLKQQENKHNNVDVVNSSVVEKNMTTINHQKRKYENVQ